MTSHRSDDRHSLPDLLENVEAKECLADNGYDGEAVYQLLRKRGMKPIIRPPNIKPANKDVSQLTERDKVTQYYYQKGPHAWRNKHKSGRREKAENTFCRFKNSFGSEFQSRDEANMESELNLKCRILNKFFKIGKPISVRKN